MTSIASRAAVAGPTRPWPAERVELWPIERLIPYADNPRLHSAADIERIAASILKWGWTNPVPGGRTGCADRRSLRRPRHRGAPRLRGDLRQVLGARHSDRDRESQLGPYTASNDFRHFGRRTEEMDAPRHVGKSLVDRNPLDEGREITQQLHCRVVQPLVVVEMATDKSELRTDFACGFGRIMTEQLLARGDRIAGTLRDRSVMTDLKAEYGDRLWLDLSEIAPIRGVCDGGSRMNTATPRRR